MLDQRQEFKQQPMEFFPILIVALIVGLALFAIAQVLIQWHSNNQQPVLSVAATVVTKRTRVRGFGSGNGTGSTRTYYYCTFEDTSGERHEFRISGREYGQLAEGDAGTLTCQGTRYKGFQRQ